MLMKRRSSPLSSTSRSLRPGNWRSRSATTSSTVVPLAETSALPFVTWRSGVGMRTVTGIVVSFVFRSPRTVGPQPHDVLRLALPLFRSPRTVGPQPHDVLRLALPLFRSPRTVGPQPHDVLRLAPPLFSSP